MKKLLFILLSFICSFDFYAQIIEDEYPYDCYYVLELKSLVQNINPVITDPSWYMDNDNIICNNIDLENESTDEYDELIATGLNGVKFGQFYFVDNDNMLSNFDYSNRVLDISDNNEYYFSHNFYVEGVDLIQFYNDTLIKDNLFIDKYHLYTIAQFYELYDRITSVEGKRFFKGGDELIFQTYDKETSFNNYNNIPLYNTFPWFQFFYSPGYHLFVDVALKPQNPAADTVWKTLPEIIDDEPLDDYHPLYVAGPITIPYNQLLATFNGSPDFMGQELMVRVRQRFMNHDFLSMPMSVYYLNQLPVTINSITPAPCHNAQGSVTFDVGGMNGINNFNNSLPAGEKEELQFLVNLYSYTEEYNLRFDTSGANILPEDAVIMYGGTTYYLQHIDTSYNASVPPGSSSYTCEVSPGLHRISTYLLMDGTLYYPAKHFIPVSSPDTLLAKVTFGDTGTEEYHVRTGHSTGTVTLNTTGGWTAGYHYSINGSAPVSYTTGQAITLNTSPQHTITVSNSDGCTDSYSFTFRCPVDIDTSNFTTIPVSCNTANAGNHNDGGIDLSVHGGIPPYTFRIDNPAGAPWGQQPLPQGDHTLYITDATYNGDPAGEGVFAFGFTIGQPPAITIQNSNITPAPCWYNKASVQVNTSGPACSSLRYYLLGDNQHTVAFTDSIPAGAQYGILAYTGAGCSAGDTITVPVAPPSIEYTSDILKASCNQSGDGQSTIHISGGTTDSRAYTITPQSPSPGTPQWINDSTAFYNLLYAGSQYRFIIRDANNCHRQASINMTAISDILTIQSLTGEDALCSERPTGKIQVTLHAGERAAPPYNYELSALGIYRSGSFLPGIFTLGDLQAGDYTLSITDGNNCPAQSQLTINNNPGRVGWGDPSYQTANTLCPGVSTGTLMANAAGGFPAGTHYRYTLSSGENDIFLQPAQNGQAIFTGLPAGTYILRVQDDTGCTATTGNIPIGYNSQPVHFELIDKKQQYCDEQPLASFILKAHTIAGNTITGTWLTYPNGLNEPLSNNDTASKDSLYAWGQGYTVTATDNIGCKNDTTIGIINYSNNPKAVITGIDPVACTGATNGSLKLTAIQDIPVGNYIFDLGGTIKSSQDDTVGYNNLKSRHYNLTITDSMGCSSDTTYLLPVIAIPVYIKDMAMIAAPCVRVEAAGVRLQASGGIAGSEGYYFVLDKGDTITGQSAEFKGYPAGGIHRVMLYDSYGCSAVTPVFAFTVRQDSLDIQVTGVLNTPCPGTAEGGIHVETLNGNPFSNGFAYTFINEEGEIAGQRNGSAFQTFAGLPQGGYSVQVNDSDNCQAVTATIHITAPQAIELATTHGYVAAKGGSTGWANALATKGNSMYTFEWYRGDSADAPGLITTQTTSTTSGITEIPAGTYLVRVQDTAHCLYWDNTEWLWARVQVPEPENNLGLELTGIVQATCHGGSDGQFVLQGTGGWGTTYYYGKDTAGTNSSNPVFEDCAAGSHTFYVRDTSGTITQAIFEMTGPGELMAAADSTTDARCYGSPDGIAYININGGNGTYYVSHNNTEWTGGDILNNLAAGNRTIYVRDQKNCSTTTTVLINQPSQILVTDTAITNTLCGAPEGQIHVQVEGGIPPYTYTWYDSVRSGQADGGAQVQGLYSGIYRLRVQDTHLCPADFIFYIPDITDLEVETLTTTPVSCYGGGDGSAGVTPINGTPPYDISWHEGTKGDKVTNIRAGTYQLTITDSEGCRVYPLYTIGTPGDISIDHLLQLPLCSGITDGAVEVQAQGGTPGYGYLWGDGTEGTTIENLDSGMYTVTVTDAHACAKQFSFNLNYEETLHTNLPETITICSNTLYPLDPGSYKNYRWEKDGGYLGSDSILYVDGQGWYDIEFEDIRGCTGRNTIQVNTSPWEMDGELLVASPVHINDTVWAVEVSQPAPDSFRIEVPPSIELTIKGPYYQYFVPKDTGLFGVSLTVYLNDCQDRVIKPLLVLPKAEGQENDKGLTRSQIRSFKLYPNPNDGNFEVEVRLESEMDVTLRLLSFDKGIYRGIRKLYDSDYYLEPFNLTGLVPGMYLLNLEAGKELQSLKLIIK